MMVTTHSQVAKPRGRPRAFDRDEALASAATTFWRLGYEGTSIADLTEAMGITPQSLYGAFHSKSDLYYEALDQYLSNAGAFSSRALNTEATTEAAFTRLFKEAAHEYARTDQPKGCMLSTAVVTHAVENEPVARHVTEMRAKVLMSFEARLQRGKDEGDVDPKTDTAALARLLQALLVGMSMQARDGASEAELLSMAELASRQSAWGKPRG